MQSRGAHRLAHAAIIDGSQMQDAVPTLAVLAAFNATPVRFTGIANLRVKECDRTRALAVQLSRIRPGLATEDGDDLLIASDPALPSPVLVTATWNSSCTPATGNWNSAPAPAAAARANSARNASTVSASSSPSTA